MAVHTRSRALVAWLMPDLQRWPREHRHGLTAHVGALACRVLDALVAARHLPPGERDLALRDADMALDQLRQYLHLALEWHWMTEAQYLHVCSLLGGWRKRR